MFAKKKKIGSYLKHLIHFKGCEQRTDRDAGIFLKKRDLSEKKFKYNIFDGISKTCRFACCKGCTL